MLSLMNCLNFVITRWKSTESQSDELSWPFFNPKSSKKYCWVMRIKLSKKQLCTFWILALPLSFILLNSYIFEQIFSYLLLGGTFNKLSSRSLFCSPSFYPCSNRYSSSWESSKDLKLNKLSFALSRVNSTCLIGSIFTTGFTTHFTSNKGYFLGI